ncbi:MAG: hypothetical protein VXZ54_00760, partial [Planctomycetota bacterium]|nr:hypothetical protein [Planctomycetota bacterium]
RTIGHGDVAAKRIKIRLDASWVSLGSAATGLFALVSLLPHAQVLRETWQSDIECRCLSTV